MDIVAGALIRAPFCATIARVMANGKLTFKRAAMRAVSVLVCAAGGAACAYSLLIQFNEVGNIMASVCWFAGLFSLVGGISGYAVTCLGQKGEKRTWAAVAAGLCLGAAAFVYARSSLALHTVASIAIICVCVQVALLFIWHFILKREDPDAL